MGVIFEGRGPLFRNHLFSFESILSLFSVRKFAFVSEGEEDKRLIMFLNKDLGANNIGSLDCTGHLVAFSSAKEFFFS